MIVLMVPQGAALEVDRVAEVAQAAGADVIETRAVPVPVTLFDRRTVHNLLVSSADTEGLSSRLRDLSDQYGVDIALQSRAARCQSYRLAVFDMDSTLIDCEVIDQLAAQAGVGEAVAEITAQAMRGELDFDESYRTRLALLEGLDARAVEELADRLPVKEGLREMTTTLKAQGLKLAIFSGGFMPIAERLQSHRSKTRRYLRRSLRPATPAIRFRPCHRAIRHPGSESRTTKYFRCRPRWR